jgi:hypothetical protein
MAVRIPILKFSAITDKDKDQKPSKGREIPPLAKALITGFERDLRGKDGAAVFVVAH